MQPRRIPCPGPIYRIAILLLPAILVLSVRLDAQTLGTTGRDFWIAFLETNGAEDAPHLKLVVTSQAPTTGTIIYTQTGRSAAYTIGGPGQPLLIDLDSSALMLPNPAAGLISRYTLRATFADDVTIYGVNTQRWSSDAFVAIPVPALGQEYIILSYPNTIAPLPPAQVTRDSDFPSQFGVVGTEHGTSVQIRPTARVKGRPDSLPFTVTLDPGQILFIQAQGKAGVDLTGTEVIASRPVAVFSGHQRTNVPYDSAIGRDHLVEQLPPVRYWGREAILTPHVELPKSRRDSSVARIVASEDGTMLRIDEVQRQMRRGEVVEVSLDRPMHVTATRPILVAEYHGSCPDETYGGRLDSIGDPFMTLIPDPAQWDGRYTFESFATKDFWYHYINLIIPADRESSVRLDGAPVETEFHPVPGTAYSYAQVQVAPGSHLVTADVPFGLNIYGYGPYNSYGYPGGMIFQRPPASAPMDGEATGGLALRARINPVQGDVALLDLFLPERAAVSLDLFDAAGKPLPRVAENRLMEEGNGAIELDLTGLPAGIYFCRAVTAAGESALERLVVIR